MWLREPPEPTALLAKALKKKEPSGLGVLINLPAVLRHGLLPGLKQGVSLEHAGEGGPGVLAGSDFESHHFGTRGDSGSDELAQALKSFTPRCAFRGKREGLSAPGAEAVACNRLNQDGDLHGLASFYALHSPANTSTAGPVMNTGL